MASSFQLVDLLFFFFAAMTLGGAGGCAFSRNLLYSAWSLLFAFLGVAGLYVFLGADFPAVVQVLIYVGGVLVLILFAIMLTRQLGEEPEVSNKHVGLPVGGVLAVLILGVLGTIAVNGPWAIKTGAIKWESSGVGLGNGFLTEWLLPFEVASVVLLAALVGSVVLARKEIKQSTDDDV
jgi:NADH-quinone oxidoreductase subunit J